MNRPATPDERMETYRDPEYVQKIFDSVPCEHVACDLCSHRRKVTCPHTGENVQYCETFSPVSNDAEQMEDAMLALITTSEQA